MKQAVKIIAAAILVLISSPLSAQSLDDLLNGASSGKNLLENAGTILDDIVRDGVSDDKGFVNEQEGRFQDVSAAIVGPMFSTEQYAAQLVASHLNSNGGVAFCIEERVGDERTYRLYWGVPGQLRSISSRDKAQHPMIAIGLESTGREVYCLNDNSVVLCWSNGVVFWDSQKSEWKALAIVNHAGKSSVGAVEELPEFLNQSVLYGQYLDDFTFAGDTFAFRMRESNGRWALIAGNPNSLDVVAQNGDKVQGEIQVLDFLSFKILPDGKSIVFLVSLEGPGVKQHVAIMRAVTGAEPEVLFIEEKLVRDFFINKHHDVAIFRTKGSVQVIPGPNSSTHDETNQFSIGKYNPVGIGPSGEVFLRTFGMGKRFYHARVSAGGSEVQALTQLGKPKKSYWTGGFFVGVGVDKNYLEVSSWQRNGAPLSKFDFSQPLQVNGASRQVEGVKIPISYDQNGSSHVWNGVLLILLFKGELGVSEPNWTLAVWNPYKKAQ